MSSIGKNHPTNPFSAAGRAAGQTAQQLNNRGLNGQGHPAPAHPSQPSNGAARPSRPAGQRTQNLSQIIQSIGSSELANQDDLHKFCEDYRALLNFLAVTAKLAEGQLKAAARATARQTKGRMLNPAQAAKLKLTLGLVGRDLDSLANSCVTGATSAVKAWRRVEALLDDLENSGNGGPRPGGGRGGFHVV